MRPVGLWAFVAWCWLMMGPGLRPAVAQSDPSTWPTEDYSLWIECRSALWTRAHDDARRAGLGPGAAPVDVDASEVTRTRERALTVFTGPGRFTPDAIFGSHVPVVFRCAGDPTTGTVRELSYAMVGEDGRTVSTDASQHVVVMRRVEACREAVEGKLASDMSGRGYSPAEVRVRATARGATLTTTAAHQEIVGGGEYRLGEAYDWAPLTYTCRYDEKRARVARVSYKRDDAARGYELPYERAVALEACREAVYLEVLADAERRGYRWAPERVRVSLKEGARFTPGERDLAMSGEGEYKLEWEHDQPTPFTWTCAFDLREGVITRAAFERRPGARTPSGQIASGRTTTIVCEAFGTQQRVCPAKVKGDVRILRQFGETPCEAYRNWIWSPSGITVWGGCRAEFEFTER